MTLNTIFSSILGGSTEAEVEAVDEKIKEAEEAMRKQTLPAVASLVRSPFNFSWVHTTFTSSVKVKYLNINKTAPNTSMTNPEFYKCKNLIILSLWGFGA